MLLTGHTALDFWLNLRHKFPYAASLPPAPPQKPDPSKLKNLLYKFEEFRPPFELVTEKQKPENTPNFRYHYAADFSKIPCVEISKGVLVVTPAYLLAWLAEKRPEDFYSNLLVACEFCSAFTRAGGSLDRFQPLLSRASFKKVETHVTTRRAARGIGKIAAALVENAYSPAEIALALRLSLQEKDGGLGLPKPILNSRLPLRRTNPSFGLSELRPDLLWPAQRVIFEYDGTQFHSQEEKIQQDSGKRNILMNEGYEVMNVTKDQLFNEKKFLNLAEFLRKRCGERKAGLQKETLSPAKLMAREVLRRVIVDYVVKGRFY